jgi:hypothetical protein
MFITFATGLNFLRFCKTFFKFKARKTPLKGKTKYGYPPPQGGLFWNLEKLTWFNLA